MVVHYMEGQSLPIYNLMFAKQEFSAFVDKELNHNNQLHNTIIYNDHKLLLNEFQRCVSIMIWSYSQVATNKNWTKWHHNFTSSIWQSESPKDKSCINDSTRGRLQIRSISVGVQSCRIQRATLGMILPMHSSEYNPTINILVLF